MASLVLTGDTSGQVTLAAPAVAGTTTLTLPATTGTVLNDATVGVCRAWVNFNGTGTVAIRGSFNVTNITDDGVGKYTVNFTTAMTDANYAVITGFTTPAWTSVTHALTYLTSSVKVECANGTTPTYADPTVFTVAIFR